MFMLCRNHKGNQGLPDDAATLQSSLEDLTKQLESIETTVRTSRRSSNPQYPRRTYAGGWGQGQRRDRRVGPCYNCGEEGHLFRNCPLNYYGPASQVDESWPHQS